MVAGSITTIKSQSMRGRSRKWCRLPTLMAKFAMEPPTMVMLLRATAILVLKPACQPMFNHAPATRAAREAHSQARTKEKDVDRHQYAAASKPAPCCNEEADRSNKEANDVARAKRPQPLVVFVLGVVTQSALQQLINMRAEQCGAAHCLRRRMQALRLLRKRPCPCLLPVLGCSK